MELGWVYFSGDVSLSMSWYLSRKLCSVPVMLSKMFRWSSSRGPLVGIDEKLKRRTRWELRNLVESTKELLKRVFCLDIIVCGEHVEKRGLFPSVEDGGTCNKRGAFLK